MSDSPIIGVHQPNFFPWLGYFHKIRWSDVFVLLDDAQIQKTGGSVTNRCELVSNGKQLFFTAAIDRSKSGGQMIREVEFATAREDVRAKLTSFLKQAYGKAPFMKELGEEILAIVNLQGATLGEYNANAIQRIAAMLDLNVKFVTSSSLDVRTASTERLVDIVSKLGGRTYLAGAGAKDYQDDSMFFAKSIQVWYRDFVPPAYSRPKDEEAKAGLSVLDALLLLGKKGTRDLLDQQPLDRSKLRSSSSS